MINFDDESSSSDGDNNLRKPGHASAEVKETHASGDFATCEDQSARMDSELPEDAADFFDFNDIEASDNRASITNESDGFVMHDVSG